jgi:hypothetical protein
VRPLRGRNKKRNNAERITVSRREAAAREDRLEREAAAREARLEARLLQTPSTTSFGYRIGAAAKEFRPFEGKEDGAAYILELTHLLGTHEVPVAQWPPQAQGLCHQLARGSRRTGI